MFCLKHIILAILMAALTASDPLGMGGEPEYIDGFCNTTKAPIDRRIKVTNNCKSSIKVSVCWHDPAAAEWRCGCWIKIAGNDYTHLRLDFEYIKTDLYYAYFYANAYLSIFGRVWSGDTGIHDEVGYCDREKRWYFLVCDLENEFMEVDITCYDRRRLRATTNVAALSDNHSY